MDDLKTLINPLLNEQDSEQKTRGQLSRRSSDLEMQNEPTAVDELYLAAAMKLILRSLELCQQPPLEPKALFRRGEVWAEMMSMVIPLEDLEESFLIAQSVHESTFPINAHDIKNGYDALAARRNREMLAEREAERKTRCSFYRHDRATGMMAVANPFNIKEDITLPCAYCRPTEYAQARKEFINASGEINPLDILTMISEREN